MDRFVFSVTEAAELSTFNMFLGSRDLRRHRKAVSMEAGIDWFNDSSGTKIGRGSLIGYMLGARERRR